MLRAVIAMLLCAPLWATPNELVFVASEAHTMPLLELKQGEAKSGILKDLGEAIAGRLGLKARFVSLSRNRIGPALEQGQVDAICYARPAWLSLKLNWSKPVIANGEVLISRIDTPAVGELSELAGKPIGTVLGYRYPELDAVLGKQFIRDDAPSLTLNLRKLASHRMDYAVVDQLSLQYQLLADHATLRLRPPKVLSQFGAQCAFSLRSNVSFDDAAHAIDGLVADGSVERILARYR